MDASSMMELAHEFAELGSELHGHGDSDAALRRMVELATKHVPACSWASITVIRSKMPRTIAHSGPVAATADQLQYELGEGPCLQAAEDGVDYLLFDVQSEPRWPRYARALLAQTPVRSVLSFQLPAEDRAALNLFCDTAGGFDDDSVTMGAVFAAHISTTVALYEAEEQAVNLERALTHSRQIGAAVGILMAHHKVTEEQAFNLLRTASQHLHIKLRDIAVGVVETGTLPSMPHTTGRSTPTLPAHGQPT